MNTNDEIRLFNIHLRSRLPYQYYHNHVFNKGPVSCNNISCYFNYKVDYSHIRYIHLSTSWASSFWALIHSLSLFPTVKQSLSLKHFLVYHLSFFTNYKYSPLLILILFKFCRSSLVPSPIMFFNPLINILKRTCHLG